MGFGVFIDRSDSIYDDSPAEQYQFPGQYLGRVQACVGDWIIYYEPRKVAATRGYFAVAKVERVFPDSKASGMYLALIERGSYLDFINPVPFSGPDGVIERGVLNEEGRIGVRFLRELEAGKESCQIGRALQVAAGLGLVLSGRSSTGYAVMTRLLDVYFRETKAGVLGRLEDGMLTFTLDDCTGCQFVCDWCTETDGNRDLRAQLRANSRSGAISWLSAARSAAT